MPSQGPATPALQRDYFNLKRLEWTDDPGIEFHLPTGPMLRLLRANGFELENFIELAPPLEAQDGWFGDYLPLEWARRWPAEEIWCLRKAV
jgi:hypothetical protein